MGWSIGYDERWKRDVGYGVPSICDQPGCGMEIDRGLGYVCGGEPFGGESGCGLFFCDRHGAFHCHHGTLKPTPDTPLWTEHKLTHESWQKWRGENPEEVSALLANA